MREGLNTPARLQTAVAEPLWRCTRPVPAQSLCRLVLRQNKGWYRSNTPRDAGKAFRSMLVKADWVPWECLCWASDSVSLIFSRPGPERQHVPAWLARPLSPSLALPFPRLLFQPWEAPQRMLQCLGRMGLRAFAAHVPLPRTEPAGAFVLW